MIPAPDDEICHSRLEFVGAAQKKTGTQGPGSLVGLARVAAPGESGWISGRDVNRDSRI